MHHDDKNHPIFPSKVHQIKKKSFLSRNFHPSRCKQTTWNSLSYKLPSLWINFPPSSLFTILSYSPSLLMLSFTLLLIFYEPFFAASLCNCNDDVWLALAGDKKGMKNKSIIIIANLFGIHFLLALRKNFI